MDKLLYFYGIRFEWGDEIFTKFVSKYQKEYQQLYKDVDESIEEFLLELRWILNDFDYYPDCSEIKLVNFKGEELFFDDNEILLLVGNADELAPFCSREACIAYYKHTFGDILPNDFDYEKNVGRISFVA